MKNRLQSIDLLRGIALLGLPTMNIIVFAMPVSAYLNPLSYSADGVFNDFVFSFFYLFADQKFMGIFSTLFGASLILLAEKNQAAGRRAGLIHYSRTFWLIVIGFLHGWFLWEGDVLMFYGVIAVVLYPFRRLNVYLLGAASFLLLSISAVMLHHDDISTESFGSELRAELQELYMPNDTQIKQREDLMLGSYKDTLTPFRQEFLEEGTASEEESESALKGVGISSLTKIWGMMCLGILLFKLGIVQGNRSDDFYWRLGLLSLPIGLLITATGLIWNYHHSWQIDAYFRYGMVFKEVGSTFMVLGYISFIVLAYKKGVIDRLANLLSSVGQMALTNYLMQSLICALIFYGYGAGLYGSISRIQLLPIIVGIWVFQIGFSVLWLAYFRQGPIEWLWRVLTYYRLQPIVRSS